MTPDEFFAGYPGALAVLEKVSAMVDRLGPFDVRISMSAGCSFGPSVRHA
jgi:hypothetical protein